MDGRIRGIKRLGKLRNKTKDQGSQSLTIKLSADYETRLFQQTRDGVQLGANFICTASLYGMQRDIPLAV